jgi:acyl-CoA thioesterase FadM
MEPPAAVHHFVHVHVDCGTGTPVPIPTIIRAVYEKYS